MNQQLRADEILPFGVGSYTAVEAALLLRTSARNVRRWMAGYEYRDAGESHLVPPLWSSQIPFSDGRVEIGFRDLIELRFVKAFVDAGVGLKAVRNCRAFAMTLVKDSWPFSTRVFKTDGRTIFHESLTASGDPQLLDLKKKQYEMRQVIERTFRDLDIEREVVARWRPFRGKKSIIIDPSRSFGQPIAAAFGVPTVALADAVEAEGSAARVARLFEIPLAVVRDAVGFEKQLRAA
jgi:uncharacterized protein (DUF433 family)